jgi:NarL family two-component system response regulator LiaR
VQVIQEILQKDPDIRIIVLTAYVDDHEVSSAFRAGASGYLLKTQAISQLVQGVRNACKGQYSLHPAVAHIMLRQLNHTQERPPVEKVLSEAERQVLVYVAKAFSNKEIARELGISHTTVRSHVNRIMNKLHVSNRTQAALYALKQGLATLERPSTRTN